MLAHKTLNVRFALILGGCLVISGVTVHFTHRYQVKRGARNLLEEATRLEQAGETTDAAEYLERYLLLEPNDRAARARYALLINSLAKTPKQKHQAYLALSDALRRDPSSEDLRRAIVPLAVGLGEFREARAELAELRKAGVEDADLMRQQARVEAVERKFEEAEKWYRKAVKAAPADPDLSLELAALLRGPLKSASSADFEVDRLVQSGGGATKVRFAAAQYYRRWGDLEKAGQTITNPAGEACADDADVLLLAAEVARALGKGEAARRHLDRGITLFPKDSRFATEVAWAELWAGRRDAALAALEPHLKTPPQQEVWRLGNLLIDLGETARAKELLGQLPKGTREWAADYLRGRLQMRQGAWAEAQRLFDRVLQPGRDSPPAELACHAHLLLAECHARLMNPDRQVDACRKALVIDPGWLPAREKLAAALVTLGQTDEAIGTYRLIVGRSPAARVELARLTIARTLRLPAAERRWGEAEDLLKDVPDPHRADAQILRAEILFAQGKADDARRLAEAERDRDPKQVGPWLFLVALAERGPDPKAAVAVVDEAERKAGPRAEWVVARTRHWLKVGGLELTSRLTGFEAEAVKLPADERDQVLLALGEAFLVAGHSTGAERAWGRVADTRPNDPDVHLRLFGLAIQRGDEARCRVLIGAIVRSEGPDGPLAAFAEATLHARRARQGDKAALATAQQAAGKASAGRPSWSAAALLEAELCEIGGDKAKAIEKYEAVVAGGRAPVQAVRRLVQLLADHGRFAEAQAVLAKVPHQLADAGFNRASANLTLLTATGMQGRDAAAIRKQGLEAARQAVQAGSTDYREYLWLGHMALLAGEQSEAEKAFRRARDLKVTVAETWVALIVLLSRTDAKKAEAELEVARTKLPPDLLPPVLAVCSESLGRIKEAGEQYKAISSGRPDDPTALRNLAGFLIRTGDQAGAEQTLRRFLTLGPKISPEATAWARRALAITLVTQGGFDRFKEATALTEENATRPNASTEDRWTKAFVLAAQPGRRRESIELLEKAPSSVPPDVRFLLARLYDRDGRWGMAQAELLGLLRTDERNPVYLTYYARGLLLRGQTVEADALVERLAKVTGVTFDTVELRARVLTGKKRSGEAAKLVKDFAAGKGGEATLPAAQLLDRLDLTTDAEQMYRNHVKESKSPTAPLLLAGFLASHGRVPEALVICEQTWKTCPPEAVAHTCVASLRVGKGGEAEAKRVEGWIDTAIASNPQSMALLILKADLKQFREQFPEAADLYRQILSREPKHVVALNNLAFLVAVKDGKQDEALGLINAALDVTGPHAELLDTRAVVLTLAGRPDEAVADLRRAIADSPSPVKQFHLAQAHLKAGRKADAGGAYREAIEGGLKAEELHPLERPERDRMAKEVAAR